MTHSAISLTASDGALLNGEGGAAAAFAMQILVAFAEALGAPALLDITRAHIDGCLYHGQASLDFVERLVSTGGTVRVPTSLNVGAVDLIHPELVQLSARERNPAVRLMKAHEELGCQPSFTCAPYQTTFRPVFGEQIAWGESNAIVFANSVIGARTNRYGDFIDLCCAMTGRAPAWGLHLDDNRAGQILFRLTGFPASQLATDSLYVAVGLLIGAKSGDRIPVDREPASASVGRPVESARRRGRVLRLGGTVSRCRHHSRSADCCRRVSPCARPQEIIEISPADIGHTLRHLSTVPDQTPITAVCLGTPHFSRVEWLRLLPLLREIAPARGIPIYVNTGRATLHELDNEGLAQELASFGVIVVVDTCTYLTPILRSLDGVVMTNSGKWAHYAPGNIGVQVAFGEMDDCIRSAAAGCVVRETA